MSADLDSPNRFPWPPVIIVCLIGGSIILGFAAPLGWSLLTAAGQIVSVGGVAVAGAAVALYAAAFLAMRNAKTNILPHRAADHLVTTGPFAISRNPIYLANVLLLSGLGLFSGNAWFLIAAAIGAFAEQKLAIEREERHLEHKFGKAWREYRKKVRRWI